MKRVKQKDTAAARSSSVVIAWPSHSFSSGSGQSASGRLSSIRSQEQQ